MSSAAQDQPSQVEWFSVAQFALSALAIFGLWSLAFGLVALGLTEGFRPGGDLTGAVPLFLMAAGTGLSGLLLLPSAAYAFLRLLGRPERRLALPGFLRPALLILVLPLVLLLGHWVSGSDLAWLLLPPLHVLAVGLPVLWLLYLAMRALPTGSLQQRWGVFGSGLVLGPALILLVELLALIVFVFFAALAIASQPGLLEELGLLVEQLASTRSSPETALRLLSPYLARPAVLFSVFAFGAVIVPLIEELIKPVGVWLLAGRGLTPAAGFAAGLLSGAGYALFESLALSSSAEGWSFLVVARIGTAVIHILTTGMTGWALALAWSEGRYLRLAATYLAAVLIHAAWNAMTLLTTIPSLLETNAGLPDLGRLSQLGSVAPAGLVVLSIGGFILLLWANRAMRRPANDLQPGAS